MEKKTFAFKVSDGEMSTTTKGGFWPENEWGSFEKRFEKKICFGLKFPVCVHWAKHFDAMACFSHGFGSNDWSPKMVRFLSKNDQAYFITSRLKPKNC